DAGLLRVQQLMQLVLRQVASRPFVLRGNRLLEPLLTLGALSSSCQGYLSLGRATCAVQRDVSVKYSGPAGWSVRPSRLKTCRTPKGLQGSVNEGLTSRGRFVNHRSTTMSAAGGGDGAARGLSSGARPAAPARARVSATRLCPRRGCWRSSPHR